MYLPTYPSISSACVGWPSNVTAARCASVVDCRWWDTSSGGEWSAEGCATVAAADGTFTCSCTHLTTFVVFEFPVTWSDLAADLRSALAVETARHEHARKPLGAVAEPATADEKRELERMNSLDRAVHAAALERFDAAVRDLPPADEDRLPYYLHMHKAGGGVPDFWAFLALVTSRGRRVMTSGPISS